MKVLVFDCFGVLVTQRRELSNLSEIWNNTFEKNYKLLDFIRKNRNDNSKIVVLSNVAQYNFDRIFSQEEQAEFFDMILLSGNLGFSKPDIKIFEITEREINDKYNLSLENEIKFTLIDDSIQNINSAREFGWNTILYEDFDDFLDEITV